MSVGVSIVLIVVGAILAFAVTLQIAGIELSTLGLILMIGGAIGLVVSLAMRRRRTTGL